MNRGVAVFGHNALRNKNGVFKVVAIPGHEGHAHVLAKGKLPHVSGSTVGHNITAFNLVTALNQGPLVNVGVLVGS